MPSLQARYQRNLAEHCRLFALLEGLEPPVSVAATRMATSLAGGGRLFFFGNGGSAADSQHLAAELCGRLRSERRALAAMALAADTAVLTAVANDHGYEQLFSRQLESLARPGGWPLPADAAMV